MWLQSGCLVAPFFSTTVVQVMHIQLVVSNLEWVHSAQALDICELCGKLLLRLTWTTAEVENEEQEMSQACGASPGLNPALSPRSPDLRAAAGKHKLSMEEQGPELQHQRSWQALGSSAQFQLCLQSRARCWLPPEFIVPAKGGHRCGEIK